MYKQSNYVISVQRALLGCLTNNFNAITIAYKEDKFVLRVYFQNDPSEQELEFLSEITTEVAADFPDMINIEEEYFVNNNEDYKEEILDIWIIKKATARV